MIEKLTTVVGLILVGLLSGCSPGIEVPEVEAQLPPTSEEVVVGSKFVLRDEPAGAGEVIQVRADATDGDDVVIVGRIGGSSNPWIDGRAAFSIVDGSLKACSDIPGDRCTKPWDYCCETPKLADATALVKVVDENGALVKSDAKALLDVKELSTVVVQGKAQRDDAGNLTILASGVFVKSK